MMAEGLQTAKYDSNVLFDIDDGSTFLESYHRLISQCNSRISSFLRNCGTMLVGE